MSATTLVFEDSFETRRTEAWVLVVSIAGANLVTTQAQPMHTARVCRNNSRLYGIFIRRRHSSLRYSLRTPVQQARVRRRYSLRHRHSSLLLRRSSFRRRHNRPLYSLGCHRRRQRKRLYGMGGRRRFHRRLRLGLWLRHGYHHEKRWGQRSSCEKPTSCSHARRKKTITPLKSQTVDSLILDVIFTIQILHTRLKHWPGAFRRS